MSKNYEKVKNYYDKGLWNENRVYHAVGKWITPVRQKTMDLISRKKMSSTIWNWKMKIGES